MYFLGIGALVNALAIVTGGLIGQLFGRFLRKSTQQALILANGVCVLFLAMDGALSRMMEQDATIMMIVSFCLGTLIGEILNIEGWFEKLGQWLKEKTGSQSDSGFINTFLTASLTVSVGAMVIVGSIQEGVYQDPSILYAKAFLDFIIVLVMASSMGRGTLFSAIPVFIIEFGVTLMARFAAGFLSQQMLFNIGLTGNIVIFCVGINLLWPGKIKAANMLPVVIVAALYSLLF